jgi:hypothetical protein
MSYKCQNCGVVSEEFLNLCNPATEPESGNLCTVSPDKVCSEKMDEMKFSCNTCGSISATSDNLCEPIEIGCCSLF